MHVGKRSSLLLSGIALIQGASGGLIKECYLSSFNLKMKSQSRSILLLLDNASCNSIRLQGKYSNIKIVFFCLPTPLLSCNHFKTPNRRFFLQYVIDKIDTANRASDVISSINILVAIRWVALAWKEVKATTITKCFKKT